MEPSSNPAIGSASSDKLIAQAVYDQQSAVTERSASAAWQQARTVEG